MQDWTKVVTNPLGLAGYALFLVFTYIARIKRPAERHWMSRVAAILAVLSVAGGLYLSARQMSQVAKSPNAAPQQQNTKVQQSTTGAGSPAVQGVQGDVTITVDQSNTGISTKKPAQRKPK